VLGDMCRVIYGCWAALQTLRPLSLQDWQVCQVSVGVLGDVCRAIEEAVAPYCDRVMAVLLANLQSDAVHRNIKPQILSAFGDVALAIGDKFEAYLSHCLTMLASAQVRGLCCRCLGGCQWSAKSSTKNPRAVSQLSHGCHAAALLQIRPRCALRLQCKLQHPACKYLTSASAGDHFAAAALQHCSTSCPMPERQLLSG